ncbi:MULTISPECIES: hypothetical protein [unclassified Sphingobacterium]|uniref:hypothetical protein n=1 Tax=unclassified Sphingobacterium TaxID=2609468 RepID=UPI0010E81C06|nr:MULTISPECIES: hypothetical protein [unclassified Sphingobacterium]MCS3556190.1 hypothetical protein [Sphingobacterium sp. JUb21]TCR08565.1 hypothetical protein EDF66_103112 [Sphingobacterium sp. JUb20]
MQTEFLTVRTIKNNEAYWLTGKRIVEEEFRIALKALAPITAVAEIGFYDDRSD